MIGGTISRQSLNKLLLSLIPKRCVYSVFKRVSLYLSPSLISRSFTSLAFVSLAFLRFPVSRLTSSQHSFKLWLKFKIWLKELTLSASLQRKFQRSVSAYPIEGLMLVPKLLRRTYCDKPIDVDILRLLAIKNRMQGATCG